MEGQPARPDPRGLVPVLLVHPRACARYAPTPAPSRPVALLWRRARGDQADGEVRVMPARAPVRGLIFRAARPVA